MKLWGRSGWQSVLKITVAGLAILSASTALSAPQKYDYDWIVFYVGDSVGGNWQSVNYGASSLNGTVSPAGMSIGGILGYNYRVSPSWLLGVQGDFNILNTGDSSTISGTSISTKTNWESYEVVRAGFFVSPNSLVYGLGGLAFAKQTISVPALSDSAWRTGYVVGGGVEYSFPTSHWNLQLEATFADYGRHTFISDEPVKLYSTGVRAALVTHFGKAPPARPSVEWSNPFETSPRTGELMRLQRTY